MSLYSIKDLEQLSGIKAHTLRIWEQRYDLLNPKRTPSNIRFYTDDDLKLLLNISVLNDHGYRISSIARMGREQIQEEVQRLCREYSHYPDQIQSLCLAMVDMDEVLFERTMGINIQRIGLERTMIDVVYPFLSRIGVLWQTGAVNPAQEHFITNLIRQKLIAAIDGTSFIPTSYTRTFILFLPEGELHEVGLLFAYYLLKSRNFKVLYLGQSVPIADLFAVCTLTKPDYVLGLFNSNANREDSFSYIQKLIAHCPAGEVLAGGQLLIEENAPSPDTYLHLRLPDDLVNLLSTLAKNPKSANT